MEERRAEIRDDVLELHADLLDGRADGEEPSAHRTFVTLGDTLNITLKENVSIISDGTTGLHSWQVMSSNLSTTTMTMEPFLGRWTRRRST